MTATLLQIAASLAPNAKAQQACDKMHWHGKEQAAAVASLFLKPPLSAANGMAGPPRYLARCCAAEVKLLPLIPMETPSKARPSSPFTTKLTPNITLGEFALNQEARRFDKQHQVDTAAELAAFLERVRRNLGAKPIVITSGYRPPAINRSVGGASSSEHLYDAPSVGAVDFYMQGVDINTVQAFCDKYWDYSVGYGAPKGFVHIGIRRGRPRVRWNY